MFRPQFRKKVLDFGNYFLHLVLGNFHQIALFEPFKNFTALNVFVALALLMHQGYSYKSDISKDISSQFVRL